MMLDWAGLPTAERPRLRLVSEEIYGDLGGDLPAPLDRRARHYYTEVQRVRDGIAAWRAGDLAEMGHLINESGASSVHNYESGSPQLITLYELLRGCPGVYGARFSGGGFRGSCIGLVDPRFRDQIQERIDAGYPVAHPEVAQDYSVHFCRLDGPARLWDGS
jgi:galactokinase